MLRYRAANASGVSCKRRKQGVKNTLKPNKDLGGISYEFIDEKTETHLPTCKKRKFIYSEPGDDADIKGLRKIRMPMTEVSGFRGWSIKCINKPSELVAHVETGPIWRGSFRTNTENVSLLYGLEVYMSNQASLEATKSASRLPAVLHFELLLRIHLSPSESDVVF